MNHTSKELKRRARESLTGHYRLAMTAFVTAYLLIFLLNVPFRPSLQEPANKFQITISFLASCIIWLLSVVLNSGVLYIHLQFSRKKDAKPADVFRFFSRRPDRFLQSTLFIVLLIFMAASPAMICSAFALWMETPLTWILMAVSWIFVIILTGIFILMFHPLYFLLIDRPDDSVTDILRKCCALMNGHKAEKLYINLSFLGLLLLSLLSLGIGLLWVIPYINQTNTEFYLSILKENPSEIPLRSEEAWS